MVSPQRRQDGRRARLRNRRSSRAVKLLVDTHSVPFQPVHRRDTPGVGTIPDKLRDVERILVKSFGPSLKVGPWIYIVKFPAGHHIQKHSHVSDRLEYVLEGEITFEGQTFGEGSFNFITAHTEYEYDIVKETTILLVFHGPPGVL
jgi:hypothetical protein